MKQGVIIGVIFTGYTTTISHENLSDVKQEEVFSHEVMF